MLAHENAPPKRGHSPCSFQSDIAVLRTSPLIEFNREALRVIEPPRSIRPRLGERHHCTTNVLG